MRNNSYKKISDVITKISKPFLKQLNNDYIKIYINWENIVGSYFASTLVPINIQKNSDDKYTLFIDAFNSSIASEFSYNQRFLSERISFYLGHGLINRIKIRKILNKYIVNNTASNINDKVESNSFILDDDLECIEDQFLSTSLYNLGKLVYKKT